MIHKLFQSFSLAFNMLTIIPFFKVHNFFKGINGYTAMFYPLVGFVLGLILWSIQSILSPFLPATHVAVIIFALWVLLTGALHLDGLSDTIDGLFVDKKRALEIMKDSHVGGMGMVFTVVFLLLKLSSVVYFKAYELLPIILMFSRLNAVLAIYFYNYISTGVTQLIKEELTRQQLLIALFTSLIVASLFSFISAFIISVLVLLFCAKFFTTRLGGLNGDNYGFIIEMSELFLLNYIIMAHIS